MMLAEFKKAEAYCRKAIQIYEKKNGLSFLSKTDSLGYADALTQISTVLTEVGDYDGAIDYSHKSKAIYEQILDDKDDKDDKLATPLYNLGNNYLGKKMPDEALPFLQRALEFDEKAGALEWIADDLDNIGLAYFLKKEYPRAIMYYDQAIEKYRQSIGESHSYMAHVYWLKGDCLSDMEKKEEALNYFQKALSIMQEVWGERHPETAKAYRKLAQSYARKGNFERAFVLVEKAFSALDYHPEAEGDPYEAVISLSQLLEVFRENGEILYDYFLENSQPKQLQVAEAIWKKAVDLIDYIRQSYREPGSKTALADNAKAVYEGAIRNSLALYKRSADPVHLANISLYFEKDKGLLLLDNWLKLRAERFANIPPDLLEQETSLAEEIETLKKSVFDLKQEKDPGKDLEISELNGKIFDLKTTYYQLIDQFEEEYPDYYRLKYDSEVISLDEIQGQILKPGQGLIQYFNGKEHDFALVVTPDQCEVFDLGENPNLPLMVENLLNSIRNNHVNFEENLQIYRQTAHELYKLLFQPFEQIDLPKKLIIIPEGMISYIPFDALLKSLPSADAAIREYDLLLKEYSVAYNYSATLLREMQLKEKGKQNGRLLGVAPRFDAEASIPEASGIKSAMGALKFNIQEVQTIQKLMGGDLLIAEAASAENFLQQAPDYQILHLSTHGKMHDANAAYSFLVFSKEEASGDYERLYVSDLYNLKLDADLVVLSACETGVGKLQAGEGVISLGRGFAWAGARSMIATLWQVNEATTRDLVIDLYRSLKKGAPKDEALRQAKLALLERSDDEAHPANWAAFLAFGNMEAVFKPGGSRRAPQIGLVALLLLTGFWFFKKRLAK